MTARAFNPTLSGSTFPAKRPLRIGLLAHGFANWGGGVDFLRIVATSLRHADSDLELHVLAPMRGPRLRLRRVRDWLRSYQGKGSMAAHRPALADLERAFYGTGAVLHPIDLGSSVLYRTTARLGLDVLLPAMSPLTSDAPPWLGYVFDFQHKHLPQFFTSEECVQRDADFGRMLNAASAVIVNARDVVNDIDRFFPNRSARVFSMPFSPAPSSDAFSVDVDDACRRHGIEGPYFIVCNQFWKHKDHGTVFKAFAAFAKQVPEVSLVCTGATNDYRFPSYFDELMREAVCDGIAGRIHTLGLIPKLDQLALIRGAIALVQPTLFEGGPGGGSVYDAVALGQRAIVSDIPVNIEISDPEVTFFRAGDANSLAAEMSVAWIGCEDRPPVPIPAELIARGIERRRACGDVLLQAIAHVMSAAPPRFGCQGRR